MKNGIASEFENADLGDPRRVRRLTSIAEAVSKKPAAGLPQLMDGDAELEGVYRFLNNEDVQLEKILAPHMSATATRCPASDFVVAHDTTEFCFNGRRGLETLGRLSVPGSQGFFGHYALAVELEKKSSALGLLHLKPMFRDQSPRGRNRPKGAADNESRRWWQAVTETAKQLGEKERYAIHVMDREADSFEIMHALMHEGHRFVIRAAHKSRRVQTELNEVANATKSQQLGEQLQELKGICEREVRLGRRVSPALPGCRHPPRQARKATLRFSAQRLFFRRGSMAPLTLPKLLNVNVIDVIEDTPPEGCEAVRWILVTREPIDTQEDVERVVDIYRCRWLIEEYFKALKTGCAFEKRQLKSRHALLNALGIFSVIAWRLLQLRALSRSEPSAPASTAISNRQISLLGKIRQQQRKPALSNAPTMEEVTLAIAQLGGHIKNNGPPGWIVLGRGYESLLLLELGWNAAHDHLKHVGQCSCDQ